MNRAKRHFSPISIFLLALVVRLGYNVTVARDYIPKYDAALYNTIALNLLNEHCYCLYTHVETISRAPLWPFVIAIIYLLTGPHTVNVRLFYCFLDSGTCLLVYYFARDLFGRRIAFWSGILAAVYTGLFIYDGWLFSEALYTFCLTGFVYALYRFQRSLQVKKGGVDQKRSPGWAVACGVFLGLASLTRPNGPILFALLGSWAVIVILGRTFSWWVVIKGTLVAALVGVALIAPWTYRNYQVTHTFIPVAIGMGDVLLGAYNDTVLQNNPIGRGLWVAPSLVRPRVTSRGHDANGYTAQDDTADTNHALNWIRTHLSAVPTLLYLHLINMWTPYTFEPGLPIHEPSRQLLPESIWYMMLIMPIPIFVLAAFGLLVTWKPLRKDLLVIYLVLAITIAQNLAFYGNMRFRAPIEPLLVVLVGGALWRLTRARPVFTD